MKLIHRLTMLLATTTPGLLFAAVTTPSLLVPAYFYPSGSGATDWERLSAAASKVSITAIINPDSGAGSSFDPVYGSAVSSFKSAGGTVLGYVSTDSGNRGLPLVQADIDNYIAWYPIDGLFIDQASTGAAELPYYQQLANYAHGKNIPLSLMANPGTVTIEDYVKVFDSVVIYEDPASNLSAYTPPAYIANYSADHFAMLVIDGNENVMKQQVSFAASNNLGYIYVNDRSVASDEWNGLPAYWEAQVSAIQAIGVVPEPAPWTMMLAGLGLISVAARQRKAS
ncbi:MAG: PEPxxWA-CTERM sorting domain-containing protein [Dechloromonas sp.]|nr:PEPxxWA-CTERM sorting domain-containing protein [Dechloromonas sp.]